MKISDLESGVPLPKGVGKYDPLIYKNAARMDVGHSFVITLEEGEEHNARGIGSSLSRLVKENGKKFKCRPVSRNQIRVWRVK